MNKNTINRPNVPPPTVQRAPPSTSPGPVAPARSDQRVDPSRPEPPRGGSVATSEARPGAPAESAREGPSNDAIDSGPSKGADERPSTGRPLSSGKKKPAKKADGKEKVQPQRAQRQQRPGGAHGAAAHAAQQDEEGAVAGGGGGSGGIDGDIGDSHRRRHVEAAHVEHLEEQDEVHADQEQETGATGTDAIKRSKGGDSGGGDGFDQGQNQREAYERYMKGNVDADKQRHDELRKKGTKDDFRIDRPPTEVEALGTPRATAHVVRLYDAWTLAGVARDEAVEKAASFLAGFASATNIRKVLAELETKPIRDVYPLEVLMRMLDERPELLPGVRRGTVLGAVEEKSVLAGHPAVITVPTDVRIKSFALLGGARPGYEFQPHKDEGKYTLLIDTPGEHAFALLAAPLQQLGRIQRETSEAILEVFRVNVWAMDKKGEPLSPEEWRARQALEDDGEDDDDDGDAPLVADDDPARYVELAANLPTQIRKALETVTRDETSASATTYSWDASFYRPGGPVGVDAILHLVVNNAGPFDPAWMKAREALANKQKEFEPGRALVTQEDFTAALRRARVR